MRMAKKRFRFRPPSFKPRTKIGTLGRTAGDSASPGVIATVVIGGMIQIAGYLVLAR